jgi:nucleotide-binding universal stress UspA family protein
MFTQSNVLFPTDFSHYALYAMKYAAAITRQYGGEVHICHVIDPGMFSVGSAAGVWLTRADQDKLHESIQKHAEARLGSLVETLRRLGVKAEYHIREGSPACTIARTAEELNCKLIVTATHGRTGFDHMFFGSVAERVIQLSTVPVLCIKHPEHEFVNDWNISIHVQKVLFPTDFAVYADQALPYAVSLCRRFNAELILYHACEVPVVLPEFMPDTATTVGADMEDHTAQALERLASNYSDCRVRTLVSTGVPYREICRVVAEEDVDLVVLPTHGHSGFVHALFGSVAERVVRRCPCPVLTVRPGAVIEETRERREEVCQSA